MSTSRSASSVTYSSGSKISSHGLTSLSHNSISQDGETASGDRDRPLEGPEINEVNVVFVKYPDECCPAGCMSRCRPCCDCMARSSLGRCWWICRCCTYKLVEHKYFETFVIVMILSSSIALVCYVISVILVRGVR